MMQRLACILFLVLFLFLFCSSFAQHHKTDTTQQEPHAINVFEEVLIIDEQTVYVPPVNFFEVELQHRSGTVNKGFDDLFGIIGHTNSRLGVYYVPVKNLMVATGITREKMVLGLEAKYNLLRQGKSPFALSYFVNASADLEENEEIHETKERLSYFHQLMIGREFSKNFSFQAGPTYSHFNHVDISFDESEKADTTTKDHFGLSFLGQYRFSHKFSLISEVDLPLTHHKISQPYPNISLGIQLVAGRYCIQLFAENYQHIDPQASNMFNHNDLGKGQFLFGLNLARNWQFDGHKKKYPH